MTRGRSKRPGYDIIWPTGKVYVGILKGEGEYCSRAREYVRIIITEGQPWPMARENDTACRRSSIECWIMTL